MGLEAVSTGSITRQLDAAGPRPATAVQLVFQEPHSAFDPRMTLRASLQAPLRSHRALSPEQRDERIAAVMAEVELDAALLDKRPGQCSGGQLQRATIARALLLEPQVLICDEATSALDALTQRTILNLLLRLQREHNLSLIVISHDMDVVRYMCDRVAVLLEGRVIEVAETKDFFAAPRHQHSQALVEASIPCRAKGLWTVLDAGEVPARDACPFGRACLRCTAGPCSSTEARSNLTGSSSCSYVHDSGSRSGRQRELRGVPEPDALHVVVADLDHQLRAQRHEGQVLAGAPPAAFGVARRPDAFLLLRPGPRDGRRTS